MTAPLYRLGADGALTALDPAAMVVLPTPAGPLSLSVAGLLLRLAEGQVTAAEAAAAGLLRPLITPGDAPWGYLLTRGTDPAGVACAVLAPAPPPPPPPPPPAPPPLDLATALASLDAAREARLAGGWWAEQDLGEGAQWYLYAGVPPADRPLIAGAVTVARDRVAAGGADAHPYRCLSQLERAAGWRPALRAHTAAQLAAALHAGADLLGALGEIYDGARGRCEAAEDDPEELQTGLDDGVRALAGWGLPPPLPGSEAPQ